MKEFVDMNRVYAECEYALFHWRWAGENILLM